MNRNRVQTPEDLAFASETRQAREERWGIECEASPDSYSRADARMADRDAADFDLSCADGEGWDA